MPIMKASPAHHIKARGMEHAEAAGIFKLQDFESLHLNSDNLSGQREPSKLPSRKRRQHMKGNVLVQGRAMLQGRPSPASQQGLSAFCYREQQ